jgi:hypothetical protein
MFYTDRKGAPVVAQTLNQTKNFPAMHADKAWFGMGYPYLIASYANHVAVSTDYGICVLKYA